MAHGGDGDKAASGSGRGSADEGEEEECTGLEPFFFDEAAAVAEHEQRQRRERRAARKAARKAARRRRRVRAHRAAMDGIRSHDPKQGGEYYTRYPFADLSKFDLDEESAIGAMRFSDVVYKEGDYWELCEAINFLAVEIVSSDVGFPMEVYGSVIARDSIDHKCVYLFRRDRDHCQLITSEDESLILTGPKRGIASIDDTYVEFDLKIKEDQQDKELSKGYVSIRGARVQFEKYKLESRSLDTRLSTVEVTYAVVRDAVEAAIAVEVLQGHFQGEIIASPASFDDDNLVLYDSSTMAGLITGDGKGVIQLSRPVVAVNLKDMLSLTIIAQTGDVQAEGTVEFAPRINGADEVETNVGDIKMLVKVTWSIIDL
ncbi:hypothetical protein ACP4OV_015954 [Aristida adscensionis]